MPITTLLFDFGGVLVRTEDRAPRAALARTFGLTCQQLEDLVFNSASGHAAQLGHVTSAQHWEFVRQTLGFPADDLPAVIDAFFGGDVLDQELMAHIRSLRPHFTVALLSNANDDLREALHTRFGIADAFDPIFISSEIGLMKPAPAIYQHVLAALGVPPQEAAFIDDFPHNIQAAQAAGIHGIQFHNREQTLRRRQIQTR